MSTATRGIGIATFRERVTYVNGRRSDNAIMIGADICAQHQPDRAQFLSDCVRRALERKKSFFIIVTVYDHTDAKIADRKVCLLLVYW
jgi:hypothetical protein